MVELQGRAQGLGARAQAQGDESKKTASSVSVPRSGLGKSVTPNQGIGSGTDVAIGGDPTVLQKIRQKILAVKEYPLLARRQNIQGNVGVVFKVTPAGGVDNVFVTSSSGSNLLDDAAVATVKRGAPFPLYMGEISLVLKFDLNN